MSANDTKKARAREMAGQLIPIAEIAIELEVSEKQIGRWLADGIRGVSLGRMTRNRLLYILVWGSDPELIMKAIALARHYDDGPGDALDQPINTAALLDEVLNDDETDAQAESDNP